MTTGFLVGAAALSVTFLLQFFFPGILSSIVSGLSYGGMKALLETWNANRWKRKEARQERRRGGLFSRRRRQLLEPGHLDVAKRTGEGDDELPLVPEIDHDKRNSNIGLDCQGSAPDTPNTRGSNEPRRGQIEAVPRVYYSNGRARRVARRQRRLDRRG